MLSELITAINNKKSIYIAYYIQNGIGIYSAEIDENLVLKGIKLTKDNLFGVKELLYKLEENSKENSLEPYNYSQEPFKYFY